MLKYLFFLILIIAVISLILTGLHLYKISNKNKEHMSKYVDDVKFDNNLGKVLVVYYSLSGNTRNIAENIKNKTNADIYEIRTAEKIKANPKFYLTVKKQLREGKYPEIFDDLPDMSKYDIIFVGSPVWWYTVSTPVLSFLKKADFHGAKIVPFSTQGSNVGTFLKDFQHNAKHAKVFGYEAFNNLPKKYNKEVDNRISAWLNSL